MEIVIIEEKENPFFKRTDIKIRVKHPVGPTPSKSELVKELASKYSVDESQVIIDYIFSQRGLGESFVSCKILQEKPKELPKEIKEVNEPVKEETKGENSETQTSTTV